MRPLNSVFGTTHERLESPFLNEEIPAPSLSEIETWMDGEIEAESHANDEVVFEADDFDSSGVELELAEEVDRFELTEEEEAGILGGRDDRRRVSNTLA